MNDNGPDSNNGAASPDGAMSDNDRVNDNRPMNSARANPSPYNPDGRPYFRGFDPRAVPSPCYVIDRAAVEWNLKILREAADRSGATMLLALKAFSPPALFPLFRQYLDGACTSGVYEARLAREEISDQKNSSQESRNANPGRNESVHPDAAERHRSSERSPFQVHTFAPAYSEDDLGTLLELSDHLIFNSLDQWVLHRDRCLAAIEKTGDDRDSRTTRARTFGLRINPECSLGTVPLYDPCSPGSRLGITAEELTHQLQRHGADALEGISEIHFHTLCEDDSVALEQTLAAVERRFGEMLRSDRIRTLNMGGGHHITRPDYNRDHLVRLVQDARERYSLDVILEPGEAAAIHTGILVASVLDLPRNGVDLAILDTSATAHMPDTLEMPYRAAVWGELTDRDIGETARTGETHWYRLGGQTCLAGDVIGDYRFRTTLEIGDRLVFDDMSHYTMVKTTTFNGIPLPSIAIWDSETQNLQVVYRPQYDDFRRRLG